MAFRRKAAPDARRAGPIPPTVYHILRMMKSNAPRESAGPAPIPRKRIYFNAMMYLSKKAYHPLSLVLRRILLLNESALSDDMLGALDPATIADMSRRANMAVVMKYALVLISSAPMLIAYPFVQKYFVKGMMIGSVKG